MSVLSGHNGHLGHNGHECLETGIAALYVCFINQQRRYETSIHHQEPESFHEQKGPIPPASNCVGIPFLIFKPPDYEYPRENASSYPPFFAKLCNWVLILTAPSAATLTTPVALPAG
jgi:hypothetical protein